MWTGVPLGTAFGPSGGWLPCKSSVSLRKGPPWHRPRVARTRHAASVPPGPKEDACGTSEGAKGLGTYGPDAHVSSGTGAEGSTPKRLAASRSIQRTLTIGCGNRQRTISAHGESTDKLERANEKEQTASTKVQQERGSERGGSGGTSTGRRRSNRRWMTPRDGFGLRPR